MRERHGRVLAELAETGLVMARRLSDALLATEDAQTQAQLGLAYHRVSRAIRQAIALEMRLWQEPRPAPAAAPRPTAATVADGPPRPPAERTGWNEYESVDSDEALEDLEVLLGAEDLDEEAVHEAVETCLAHIRRDLDAGAALAGFATGTPAAPSLQRLAGSRPATTPPNRPLALPLLAPDPGAGARRSQLMGGATALRLPPLAPARAPPLARPSSA
ncbi:hypothetical protein [Phenylobacterium sp.]|uniref:hypothetical protein n=1 Tax=Phenylobacterium sp. TaxID=1871053 RepID=UPI0025D8A498|nr:hypothetical protein [Phenylobacterium sp.]